MASEDLIVIGGGTAGLGAARRAVALGARPVLISDGPLGGDCTFTGCIPSKTLIAAGRRGDTFADAMATVRATIEHVAATENAAALRAEGADVVEGRARLVSPTEVDIDGRRLRSEHVVIATGARPAIPPIPGIEDVAYLTSETLFDLDRCPARIGIIGAGPVGCEMAMAFSNFANEVTVFEALERILPNEEPEASVVIADRMGRLGVTVRTGALMTGIRRQGNEVVLDHPAGEVRVDALLVAAGRRANTGGLGLEELGVELDERGNVVVDDRLRTNVDGVSAAGDVTGLLAFTHAAYEQGRIAVGHALGRGVRWRYRTDSTPWVTFTDPEVARVGVREAEADDSSTVAYLPMAEVDRAITEGRTDGFVKLIAAPRAVSRGLFGGRLVGATIVAPRAGEMIHGPTLSVRQRSFVGRLAQTTTAYPTWSLAVQMAAVQFIEEIDGRRARPVRS